MYQTKLLKVGHHSKRWSSNVNSLKHFLCAVCLNVTDLEKKVSSLFSVKCLGMIIFLFYILLKHVRESEKYFMMTTKIWYSNRLTRSWSNLISSFFYIYILPLASSHSVYLIQFFHPIYRALPNLFSYIVLALIFLTQPSTSIVQYFFSICWLLVSTYIKSEYFPYFNFLVY